MAGKGNTFDQDFLKLIFQATPIANIADNAATSPITNIFVSLHTADPGPAGNQTTNEATYTGYARIAVARTSGGWSLSSQTISNVADVLFATCTGGANTITFVGIGTLTSGTGKLLYSGALTASLAVSNGIAPDFAAGTLTITES